MSTRFTYVYRWRISQEDQEEFRKDWTELTIHIRSKYGALGATLYISSATGEHVAVAQWPSDEARLKWVRDMVNHPLRIKYRDRLVYGPEQLVTVTCVNGDTHD